MYVDFSDDDVHDQRLEELLRALHGVSAHAKPPLGPNPFATTQPVLGGTREELDSRASPIKWYDTQRATANTGLAKVDRRGALELQVDLSGGGSWSQLALYKSVKDAEIRTFGWPIGVVLDNREEFRPQPRADGVYAEVSIRDKGFSEATSYDYWALRDTGSFYLLQSLFEDERTEGALFFNTRIVRVTEALMFLRRLYGKLGTADERVLSILMRHQGLAGRTLTSSNPNRIIDPATTAEDVVDTTLATTIGNIDSKLLEYVKHFCAPLFMVYEFKEFADQVYEGIVERFQAGEVT